MGVSPRPGLRCRRSLGEAPAAAPPRICRPLRAADPHGDGAERLLPRRREVPERRVGWRRVTPVTRHVRPATKTRHWSLPPERPTLGDETGRAVAFRWGRAIPVARLPLPPHITRHWSDAPPAGALFLTSDAPPAETKREGAASDRDALRGDPSLWGERGTRAALHGECARCRRGWPARWRMAGRRARVGAGGGHAG